MEDKIEQAKTDYLLEAIKSITTLSVAESVIEEVGVMVNDLQKRLELLDKLISSLNPDSNEADKADQID